MNNKPHNETDGAANRGGVYPPQAPPRRKNKDYSAQNRALLSISAINFVALAALIIVILLAIVGLASAFTPRTANNNPPSNSFAVIRVVGTINNASSDYLGTNNPSYNHGETVKYINSLSDNNNNKGIMLYMNTGGGGVYESDEVYRALEKYKEKTGRPVWAYMETTCASGGVYICAAAEKIYANYNTTTGSIGVYISLVDASGLYEKLGVESVLIRTGENKGIGVEGVEISEENRKVYQSIVDESYQRFVEIVAKGRNMEFSEVEKLADGRPYTANQALANGLVDELTGWEEAKDAFSEHTGASAHQTNFGRYTTIGNILSRLASLKTKTDAELLLEISQNTTFGVPMAEMSGLFNE